MTSPHPTLAIKWATVDVVAGIRDLDSPERLAHAMGIDRSNLSRVRRGKQIPGPRFIAALCTALELTPSDVIVVLAPGEAAPKAVAA